MSIMSMVNGALGRRQTVEAEAAEPYFPEAVLIGHMLYRVSRDEEAIMRAIAEEGESLDGHLDVHKQHMAIRPGLAPDYEAEVVVHEWLHGETRRTGLREELGDEMDEKLVSRLAPALLSSMRANPALMKYLLELWL